MAITFFYGMKEQIEGSADGQMTLKRLGDISDYPRPYSTFATSQVSYRFVSPLFVIIKGG